MLGREISTGGWDTEVWRAVGVQTTPRSAKLLGLWFAVVSSDCHRSQEGEAQLPRNDAQ